MNNPSLKKKSYSQPIHYRTCGFSLPELLIVMLIVALISSVSVPILRIKIANDAAMRYAMSIRSRIEEGLSMCGINEFTRCILGLSTNRVSRTQLVNIARRYGDMTAWRSYNGSVNYVHIFLDRRRVRDAQDGGGRGFQSRDDATNYNATFDIRSVIFQDGAYFSNVFLPIRNGLITSTGNRSDNATAIYVFPAIPPTSSEFLQAAIYRISLSGGGIIGFARTTLRQCNTAAAVVPGSTVNPQSCNFRNA